jgi:hypothetical protein
MPRRDAGDTVSGIFVNDWGNSAADPSHRRTIVHHQAPARARDCGDRGLAASVCGDVC